MGLTRYEKRIIIFLISIILLGSGLTYYKKSTHGDLARVIHEIDSHYSKKSAPVNINTADEKTLTRLDGIGPVLASRIVEYRMQNGPFRTRDDIKKVKGIGPKKFEIIKDSITTE